MRKVVLGAVLLLLTPAADAGERLTIVVTPIVAYAPANVRVRARVESNADNRSIQIVADSTEFYRSSEIQLDGERAPRTTVVEFRNLPSGTYNVTAVLVGSASRTSAVRQIKIVNRVVE
jgi:hypothetical protein